MVSSGLHFPFEDSCIHIKILNKRVCFFPVHLLYVSLILRPVPEPKGKEGSVSSPTPGALGRHLFWKLLLKAVDEVGIQFLLAIHQIP